jgi:hypothetical protein
MYWLGLAKPDTDFFGGQDLPNLQAEITVTIKSYAIESIRTQSSTTKKGVLYFEEEGIKPLIVNKTKLKPLVVAYGYETDSWIGKRITLYFDPTVKFGREITGGIRVKLPREKPLPLCEKCGNPIKGAGKMNPEQTAAYTKNKYGKALCSECATAQAKELQG